MANHDAVGDSDEQPKDHSLFFGTIHDLKEFDALRQAYLKYAKESTSTRLVVLETWILLDYSIRGLLMTGLGLQELDHEDLDLRYALLPRGFRECVDLLRRLWAVNKVLPPKPPPTLRAPGRMWAFFKKFDEQMYECIQAANAAYHVEYGLEPQSAILVGRYRSVPEGWLDVAAGVDDSWQKGANRLNNARNLAAHCHDEMRIASKLGFQGQDALTKARAECQMLAQTLIGVS